jgi:tRNA(His) guanylyltransferase
MQDLRGKTANLEIFSGIKIRSPIVVRVDGRGFKKVLENSKKPYDLEFAENLALATERLFKESGFSPILAFIFSDEVNLFFLEAPFSGRIEKIDSVIASFISAALALALGRIISMDCRILLICENEVPEYLAKRQDEAWKNHVFSYGFYALVNEGKTHRQAMESLRGMKEHEIHELVFQKGVNLAKTASWERRGLLIYREYGEVIHNWDLPLFRSDDGLGLLNSIIENYKKS